MKKFLFVFIFTLYGITLFGQQENPKKPEYIIIANNTIITKEKLEEYAAEGKIKAMNKGVTQEERDQLAEKFGDKVGDREFIIKIDLLSADKIPEQKNSANDEKNVQLNFKNQNDFELQMANQLKLNINDSANNFTVEMIDGKEINLADLNGKVVLLNFWATWCAPCLMEFAEFPEKILEPFKDEDFILIAVSIGESKDKVEKKMDKMKKYGVDFNVGIDQKKEIWDKYATGAIPKSFLIDQNGIIKYISIGNAEGKVDELAKEIKILLAQ